MFFWNIGVDVFLKTIIFENNSNWNIMWGAWFDCDVFIYTLG